MQAAIMTESTLWRRIQSGGIGTLAVMGMTKNTGKTVALNHLLAQAAAARKETGVTSIGRDGEDRDQVFFFPKPPVMVWPGTIVATAGATLPRSKVRYKVLGSTGIGSPMGEILVVKVLEYGAMEIAGASRSSDQCKVISRLQQCGAALVVLDGALGRSHHASPAIADGVVLATGAALGGGIQDVIRKTRDRLAILGIAQADEATQARCAPVFAQGGVGLWNSDGDVLFQAEIATLNAGPLLLRMVESGFDAATVAETSALRLLSPASTPRVLPAGRGRRSTSAPGFFSAVNARSGVATIAVSGAVGRSLWRAMVSIAAHHPGLTVVVADGTKLFIDSADLAAFQKLGATLLAYRGIRIAGITLNPFSPMGGSFEPGELLAAARQAFSGHAVSDVMWDEKQQSGEVL